MKLEKALLECADSNSRSKAFECSLQIAQDELKRFEQDNQQHKQDIQQLVQSVDEQRSMIADLETKLAVKFCICYLFCQRKYRCAFH